MNSFELIDNKFIWLVYLIDMCAISHWGVKNHGHRYLFSSEIQHSVWSARLIVDQWGLTFELYLLDLKAKIIWICLKERSVGLCNFFSFLLQLPLKIHTIDICLFSFHMQKKNLTITLYEIYNEKSVLITEKRSHFLLYF